MNLGSVIGGIVTAGDWHGNGFEMHIDSYSFGHLEVDGAAFAKDVILLRGEVLTPWWRSAGGHVFAPEDLGVVLAVAPEVVVLGTGYFGRVNVLDETRSALADVGSEVVVERTRGAVDAFNRLAAEGREVAAALHLTC